MTQKQTNKHNTTKTKISQFHNYFAKKTIKKQCASRVAEKAVHAYNIETFSLPNYTMIFATKFPHYIQQKHKQLNDI